MICFQCQEEGGNSNRTGGYECQLNWFKWITAHKEKRQNTQDGRKGCLHQKQGSGTLNIVNNSSSLIHDMWHICKIVIQ